MACVVRTRASEHLSWLLLVLNFLLLLPSGLCGCVVLPSNGDCVPAKRYHGLVDCAVVKGDDGKPACLQVVRENMNPAATLRVWIADLPAKYSYNYNWENGWYPEYLGTVTPFGRPFDLDLDAWVTHHHTTRWLFDVLLRRSTLLVPKVQQADVVWVPFNLDQLWHKENSTEVCMTFMKNMKQLLPHIFEKPHFMVTGINDLMARLKCWRPLWEADPATEPDLHKFKSHLTFLTVGVTGISYTQRWWPEEVMMPIPYPSIRHFAAGSAQRDIDKEAFKAQKNNLATSTFASRLKFRELLRDHCLARPTQCRHFELQDMSWDTLDVRFALDNYRQSWFCLQPAGDTAYRKSVFDCLTSGALPVGFEHQYYSPAALMKYFPFSHIIDWGGIMGFINQSLVDEGNLIDFLELGYPPKVRALMLDRMMSIRHLVQYSLHPVPELVRFDTLLQVDAMDDAFTLSLKSMLFSMCYRKLLPEERCADVRGMTTPLYAQRGGDRGGRE